MAKRIEQLDLHPDGTSLGPLRVNNNENYKKINQAFSTLESLPLDVEDAKIRSNEAITKADRVEKELSNAILQGDSSPLAGQLSVGFEGSSYDGAQQRFVGEAQAFKEAIDSLDRNSFGTIGLTLDKMLNNQPVKVVCGGDSNTWGYDPTSPGDQIANPYPKLLEYRLRTFYDNDQITVVNTGVSGSTTNFTKNTIQQRVIDEEPDLYILMIGANDLKSAENHIPLPLYIQNLTEILSKVRAANIDVILMSPPANYDPSRYPERIDSYVHAMKSVANRFNCFFIDLIGEMNRMFSLKLEDPRDLFPDSRHFREGKAHIIADTIMTKATHAKWLSDCIRDNNEASMYLYRSPFVEANGLSGRRTDRDFFKSFYVMSNVDNEAYLTARVFIPKNGMDIVLRSVKSTNGGVQDVYVNGKIVKTIDFYSPSLYVYGNEVTLIEAVDQGYYEIHFPVEGLRRGSSTGDDARSFFGEILIRPTDAAQFVGYGTGGDGVPAVELFESLISGRTFYQSFPPNSRRAMFLKNKQIELKPNKKLILEIEGKFFSGSGLTWFGNHTTQSTAQGGSIPGYTIYANNTTLTLFRSSGTGIGQEVASAARATNFADTLAFRIEHSYSGEIKVFVNETLFITHRDNFFSSGYVGIYSFFEGKVKINRCEYAYI